MREGDREPKNQLSAGNESQVDETQHQDIRYQPSTSLEQISDWLTKIIVGLALVDIAKIPGKLDALASYIASGIGGSSIKQSLRSWDCRSLFCLWIPLRLPLGPFIPS